MKEGQSFFCIGLSYRKADASLRGKFSLDESGIQELLTVAHQSPIEGLVVLSTCNRTELYGVASRPCQLFSLLCDHTQGTIDELRSIAYVHVEDEAINHLFNVGTGLDSQILGDFEIIGQLKLAFKRSKKYGLVNPYMERLINSVIQASKRIKNETELSSGATSVSFASVSYILNNFKKGSRQKILLFGTGKIGRNTCENLVKHTSNKQITLINRTRKKAELIAGKFDLVVREYAQLEEEIAATDILIVATGAQHPTISKNLIYTSKPLLILDLSIPRNVTVDVEEHDHVKLVHLDELSQITTHNISQRENFIPQAQEIIEEIKEEFYKWQATREFAPTMSALKSKLKDFKAAEIKSHKNKIKNFNEDQADLIGDRIIQKIAGHFANHLRNDEESTQDAIELLNKVFNLEVVD
ncbi:MAG: glutamyl-tRNA reductase [Nonlabens sp.]